MSISTSFKKKPAAPAAVTATAPETSAPVVEVIAVPSPQQNSTQFETALVPQAAGHIGDLQDFRGVGGFHGEFTSEDMAIPYLSILQKTSKGFEENMDWLGQWVFDKSFPMGDNIRVIFTKAVKFYVEKTEFGSEVIPQRFFKIDDVRSAGLKEDDVQPTAELDVLIEFDSTVEGVNERALFSHDKKSYVIARYNVRNSAYSRTVGILFRDFYGFLQKNFTNGFYQLRAEQKKNDKGTFYTPLLRHDGPTSLALREEIVAHIGVPG